MTDIKEQVLEILGRSGFDPKRSGDNIMIGCPLAPYSPLHKSKRDSRPSMGIKVDGHRVLVNCFTCGFRSGALGYLYSRLNYHDKRWSKAMSVVKEFESNLLTVGLDSLEEDGWRAKKMEHPDVIDEGIWDQYRGLFNKYFLSRGISLETGKRWGVGFDKQRKRALIPVRNKNQDLVGAVGRSVINENPKYLNYFEMKKSKVLCGEHLVDRQKTIVLVEGSLDAMIADQTFVERGMHDYGAISLLGASISEYQANRIVSLATDVLLAFDNDPAGQRATVQAEKMLGNRVMLRKCKFNSKDFGGCSSDEIVYAVNNSFI